MTRLALPGGTDVAEMALFAPDALPTDRCPNNDKIDQLAAQAVLIRFSTGADGGYLLHIYIDEAIPEDLLKFCDVDDCLQGQFVTETGKIAFGGLESTFRQFNPNANIRADSAIAPGRYRYVAYRTDIPDELVNQAIDTALTNSQQRLLAIPTYVVLTAILATFVTMASQHFFFAAGVVVSAVVTFRLFVRSSTYVGLKAKKRQAQLGFPSIILELKSEAIPLARG
jgi:hypothetical protein